MMILFTPNSPGFYPHFLMKLTSTSYFFNICIFVGFITSANTDSKDYPSENEIKSSPNYKFDAKDSQFPWIIIFKTLHHCMGTLIHPSWVLTAASCLEDSSDPSYYQLQLGHTNVMDAGNVQVRAASELHPYPHYKSSQLSRVKDYANNIALMKMETPFINGKTLTLGNTRLKSDTSRMRLCSIVGLVREASNPNEKNKVLQFTRVFILTFKDCINKFVNQKKIIGMWNTLCTVGVGKNSQYGCSGDPGGPLICPTQNEEWKRSTEVQLVGVSSWNTAGVYCGAMSRYTDVGLFSEWLNNIMIGNSNHSRNIGDSARSINRLIGCSKANISSHTILFQIGVAIGICLGVLIILVTNPMFFIF